MTGRASAVTSNPLLVVLAIVLIVEYSPPAHLSLAHRHFRWHGDPLPVCSCLWQPLHSLRSLTPPAPNLLNSSPRKDAPCHICSLHILFSTTSIHRGRDSHAVIACGYTVRWTGSLPTRQDICVPNVCNAHAN